MAFVTLKSMLRSFPFSVLLLHQLLLLSTAVAQRQDIFESAAACACCDVTHASSCCSSCLQRAVILTTLKESEGELPSSTFASRLLRGGEGEGGGEEAERYMGGRRSEERDHVSDDDEGERRGDSEGEAPLTSVKRWRPYRESRGQMCQCCSKTSRLATSVPWLALVSQACCALCRNADVRGVSAVQRRQRLPSFPSSSSSPSYSPRRDDVSEGMTSPVKRMTSMECMCCMNSGISDCCSKCRVF